MDRCTAYAVDRDLVIDCVLPLGHDGTHNPGDLDRIHRSIREGEAEIASGARIVTLDEIVRP